MFSIGFFRARCSKAAPMFAVYFLFIFAFVASAANTDYWALNFTTSKKYQYHFRQSFKMIESVKYVGFYLMRCSHFPRDPSFYDACDELGLLLVTEAPTWGRGHTSYSALFWTRLLGSFKEMVLQGNNHTSIIGYGYFNEPSGDFSAYYAQMKKRADSITIGLCKYLTKQTPAFPAGGVCVKD